MSQSSMDYVVAIDNRVSELVDEPITLIGELTNAPEAGINLQTFFTINGERLRLDYYYGREVWNEQGPEGIADVTYKLMKSELESRDV